MTYDEAIKHTLEVDPGIGMYRKAWPGCEDHARFGVPRFIAPRANGEREIVDATMRDNLGQDYVPTDEDRAASDWTALWLAQAPNAQMA